ncbi:2-polyprenyl-6-methoxyphenol hydroxylase-like FAD-dependent oxidoreductase [Novosphingobium hassiacum]|uniref:2-polyprenyl-6-methoxyphenol hydroxylase-like FAD-dependent oxidoreductase n=1 Tax=Novosphingobium hassiacum TaxID=173676 RepID=A0A7W5ZYH3_9SPHN|nr:flavin-dependent oxidoreductase [Novosphingobium hassiacum]MBB3862341.1 2-polyprenyl-6-methoxyphenol hydroxylase-like FAD-dependent oxidoreductase [Novosphingobium hassiacum]
MNDLLGESEVTIVGAGIAGLALAIHLHRRGIICRIYEQAPELRELGVGITILPHAMRELAELGLQDLLLKEGIETADSRFFNRFGQLIYGEPRGLAAGYAHPEVGVRRAKVHSALLAIVRKEIGPEAVVTDRRLVSLEQTSSGTTLSFVTAAGTLAPTVQAQLVIGCDGVNSNVRRQFYPEEKLAFAGINTWRGITRFPAILGGRTYLRIGSIRTGKMVIYPIADDIDGSGLQLINWVAEIQDDEMKMNDWNKAGDPAALMPLFGNWKFDWLDVRSLITNADTILEYPMVDKDPIDLWSFDNLTLAGDAAHPMYPRGSNGAAQALIDARVLAECLREVGTSPEALQRYESQRRPATSAVVRANRAAPPDIINIRVEELTGDRPFSNIDDVISQEELRNLSDSYKIIAGFAKA